MKRLGIHCVIAAAVALSACSKQEKETSPEGTLNAGAPPAGPNSNTATETATLSQELLNVPVPPPVPLDPKTTSTPELTGPSKKFVDEIAAIQKKLSDAPVGTYSPSAPTTLNDLRAAVEKAYADYSGDKAAPAEIVSELGDSIKAFKQAVELAVQSRTFEAFQQNMRDVQQTLTTIQQTVVNLSSKK